MKSIIFDLDDTLYVSKELRKAREKALLDFLGDKKERYFQLRKKHSTIKAFNKLGIKKNKFYQIIDSIKINLKKDVKLIELLNFLKKSFKLVVLSNNSNFCVKKTLDKLGILNLIEEIYTGENFQNVKPAEECFSMVKSGDICVGNNFRKDLSVPKNKGAITILVNKNKEFLADFCIENIYGINLILKKINNKKS